MTKRWLAGVGVGAAVLAGCGPSKRDVATVNGKEITQEDFEARLMQSPGARSVMQEMILENLIFQEADKQGVKVTDADVDNFIQWQKDQNPPGRFEEIAYRNNTEESVRRNIRAQLILRALALKGVTIAQDSVQKFYTQNAKLFQKPEWKQVGFVLTKSKDDAQKAATLLKQGVDFIKVDQQFSADPTVKTLKTSPFRWFALQDGTLLDESRKPIPLPPAVVGAITKTPAGKSTDAIPLGAGGQFLVVKVDNDVPSAKIPLSEVQAIISSQIAQKNNQGKPIPEILSEITKSAQIDIKLDQFKDLAKPENLVATQTQPVAATQP